jgi:hypothetical protein
MDSWGVIEEVVLYAELLFSFLHQEPNKFAPLLFHRTAKDYIFTERAPCSPSERFPCRKSNAGSLLMIL